MQQERKELLQETRPIAKKKEGQNSAKKPRLSTCDCNVGPENGHFYTHLGAAPSIASLRNKFESQTGFKGNALRIEKVIETRNEGKSETGCPLAKWVIRRSSPSEKLLLVVKTRENHNCDQRIVVVVIVAWDGLPANEADDLYDFMSKNQSNFGDPVKRGCSSNRKKTCSCQGDNPESSGVSFSFGCSFSVFFSGCKFARSKDAKKFNVSELSVQSELEMCTELLVYRMSVLLRTLAPTAYQTMIKNKEGVECRLGCLSNLEVSPFAGLTLCMDFCAHAHRDINNMENGSTVDPMGGVALALSHGSVLLECARHELHASTALRNPNRASPSRIAVVLYQHKMLNKRNHGAESWGKIPKLKLLSKSFFKTAIVCRIPFRKHPRNSPGFS
ncbi:hypothetical protein LSTR_LSTR006998 [Laodelphax striatellus]|uniref:Methylcytosine dioxygenase TET n=1 Tax=Laodelphax striatellus TaxID=195883 RepID=A0A482WJW3_LAOST|nr:hypothetical protein LSTR_LSTR006998 [Laodelphax striatellus]